MKATIFISIACIFVVAWSRELPSYFPRCYRDDPSSNDCFIKASETMRPYLRKGIPELGIPSVEPLVIPRVHLEQGTGSISLNSTFTNVRINGMSDYIFEKLLLDPKTLEFHGVAKFPLLVTEADCDMNGRLLVAPITGKGRFYANITNSYGLWNSYGELYKRKGETYYRIANGTATIKIGGSSGRFEGLFNGNKQLTDATNLILRENSDEIIKEVVPALEAVAKDLLVNTITRIFGAVPYDKIVPSKQKIV